MHRGRDPHLFRHLLLLSLAAAGPVALGIAMHEEHLAMQRPVLAACEPEVVALPTPIAIATPTHEPAAPAPVVERAGPIPLTYGEAFAFVVPIDGAPHVVLSTTVEDAWIGGSARMIDDESLRRPVDLDALPDDVTARLGASFHAYGNDGWRCSGTLGVPLLHAAAWDWENAMYDDDPAGTDSASVIWTHGRRLLVAPLDGAGECEGATWARAADLPPPVFATAIERPSKHQVQAARRGVLRTAEMRTAAADLDTWTTQSGSEPDPALGRVPRLRDRLSSTAWDLGGDGVDAVVLDVDGPEYGGCGGLEPHWAVALVHDDGATLDRILPGDPGQVLGLVDVDGDGTAEVLLGSRGGWEPFTLARLSPRSTDGPGLEPVAALEAIPFFGCPC